MSFADVMEFFGSLTNLTGEVLSCVRTRGEDHGLADCYVAYDALPVGVAILCAVIAYSFIWSIVGNNCSKVDQIWSITPVMFSWHFYLHYVHNPYLEGAGGSHPRLLLLCLLVTCWGVRLTYNFWRRGGYGNFFVHEEDYRWPILRKQMHPVTFFFFNATFIATYQNVLLFLLAFPAYLVMLSEPAPLGVGEGV
jgi:steroid 5-alpha reductase family enzyme